MTEHSKIPLPGEPVDETAGPSSLLERASGAFGLNPFRPAKMPAQLDEPRMKRAKVARGAAPAFEEPRAEPEALLPVPAPTREAAPSRVIEQPVRFRGPRHEVDRDRLAERGMIVPEVGATALLEEFRIVKRQILASAQAAGEADARRVLICSPHPGEGKTFCAINLAIAMAGERDGEVLLVDADFAKPSILSTLGLPKGPGLMDALADPAVKVEDLVLSTDIPGLFVLPAGDQTPPTANFLPARAPPRCSTA